MADVIRRAAEIQSAQSQSSQVSGVSEQELRRAAGELGIDSSALDAALQNLGQDESPRFNLWGGPTQFEKEHVFAGNQVESAWEDILSDLRRTFRENGTVERRGTTHEWAATGGGVDFNTITIQQNPDATRIKVTSNFGGLAAVFYMLGVIPTLIATGVVSALAIPAVLKGMALVGVLGASFLAVRALVTRLARKRSQTIAAVIDRIQNRLSSQDGVRERLASTTAPAVTAEEDRSVQDMA